MLVYAHVYTGTHMQSTDLINFGKSLTVSQIYNQIYNVSITGKVHSTKAAFLYDFKYLSL